MRKQDNTYSFEWGDSRDYVADPLAEYLVDSEARHMRSGTALSAWEVLA